MTRLLLPELGEDVTEATIVRWLKASGDFVEVDEPLLEVETEKVIVEVPCQSSGVLTTIFVVEGETVAIGTEIAALEP
jgi:pyruvate/2-oxoglutarate dehydrogenase complex dihydrolipoamide acyltransferase (E2) component